MAAVAGVLIGLLLVGLSLAAPPDAAAIPAFSRMFGQSCSACHNPFPQLNQAGEEFRLSGYTRFEGGTAIPKVPPITAGKLSLPGIVPLSIAATLGFDYHRVEERSRETGATTTTSPNSFNLEEVELLAGAPLNKHLSFFVDFALAETEFEEGKFTLEGPDVPMLAAVSFNNLFVDDLLNLRVGAYELPVGFSPEHRRISIAPYGIYEASAPMLLGLEGPRASGVASEKEIFMLAESQLLAELYGTAYSERLGVSNLYVRYHIGTSNDSNVNADNNESKSIFGRLSVTFMDQTLGFFGLYSPDVLDKSPPAGFPKASSSVTRFGPDVHLRFFDERLTVKLQHLFARDSDPTGVGTPFEFSGGFVEVNYLFPSPIGTFVPLARFDYVLADKFDNTARVGATALRRRGVGVAEEPVGEPMPGEPPTGIRTKPRIFAYTLGLQYLPWENVKLQAEATYRETTEELSREEATVERDQVREWLIALQVRLAF